MQAVEVVMADERREGLGIVLLIVLRVVLHCEVMGYAPSYYDLSPDHTIWLCRPANPIARFIEYRGLLHTRFHQTYDWPSWHLSLDKEVNFSSE